MKQDFDTIQEQIKRHDATVLRDRRRDMGGRVRRGKMDRESSLGKFNGDRGSDGCFSDSAFANREDHAMFGHRQITD